LKSEIYIIITSMVWNFKSICISFV
jgi:hypothetical protein